ncbi:MAG: hypothetical protein QG646_3454 [Euryarchaeota archaeon]|nr:hypothetical protein [Euryarchaeota archaeon]
MPRRVFAISFTFVSFILISVPVASCISSPPIVYIAGDGSGDYNCDGNSDQIQINRALEFVASKPEYTTVYLKGPFTYSINDTILIGRDSVLEGDSSTVIKLADHAGWPTMKPLIGQMKYSGNDNITVRGFEVNVNNEGNSEIMLGKGYYNVMYFTHCSNVKVHDMYMHDGNGDGLRVRQGKNIQFYNNTIYKLGHDGLFAIRCENVKAWNNRITCRTNSGLRIWNSNNVELHDNFIDSFHHWSAGGPGIQIDKGPDGSNQTDVVNDVEVYNNIISNTFGPGIWMVDNDNSTGIEGQEKSVHIHNNIFYSTGTNPSITTVGGIVANGFNYTFIENNVFDRCYGATIFCMSPPEYVPKGGFKTIVRNNIILNTQKRLNEPNETGYAVINDFPETNNLVLQNNCLYNNSGGVYKNCSSTSDIYVNPLFADRKNHDYHLLSTAGRFDGENWIKDKVSSPCIDAGYPYSDSSKEPEPNGNRINIGPDGNTQYASKSGVNNQTMILPSEGFSSDITPAPSQIISPMVNETQINETQITNYIAIKKFPAIYRDRIVWQDYRNENLDNGSWDIYMFDLSTSVETRITTNKSWQENPKIFGDRIVWEDGRNGNKEIYMYNISTLREVRITNDGFDHVHPAIYGDRIVWEKRSSGINHDIFMYNISTDKEVRITNDGSDNIHPNIYSDRIVWERCSEGQSNIYMYNISTNKLTAVTVNGKSYNPAIYGDRVVWEDHRLADEFDLSSSDIYEYDLLNHNETQISTSKRACYSAIFGNIIVWQDYRNGNDDIYMYDISTSREAQITTNKSEQEFPAIYGDSIVWQDYRNVPYKPDIYSRTISYQPAVFCSPESPFEKYIGLIQSVVRDIENLLK